MTLKKKIIITIASIWGLSILWALATGNTSKEAALQNKFIDICEDTLDELEDEINTQLVTKAESAGYKNNTIEVVKIIEESARAERGSNGQVAVGCFATVENDFGLDSIKVTLISKLDNDGDIASSEYAISEIKSAEQRAAELRGNLKKRYNN